MRASHITPTGQSRTFGHEEIIVSKTDPQGRITYANDVFVRVSGYSLEELLGQPHNLIRHPDMPSGVFKLLWDTLNSGQEIFAYVNNLAADGAHYWVLAHITPTLDTHGRIKGHHSNRRSPSPTAVTAVEKLYSTLCAEERRHTSRKVAAEASAALLGDILQKQGQTYEEYVWSLIHSGEGARRWQ